MSNQDFFDQMKGMHEQPTSMQLKFLNEGILRFCKLEDCQFKKLLASLSSKSIESILLLIENPVLDVRKLALVLTALVFWHTDTLSLLLSKCSMPLVEGKILLTRLSYILPADISQKTGGQFFSTIRQLLNNPACSRDSDAFAASAEPAAPFESPRRVVKTACKPESRRSICMPSAVLDPKTMNRTLFFYIHLHDDSYTHNVYSSNRAITLSHFTLNDLAVNVNGRVLTHNVPDPLACLCGLHYAPVFRHRYINNKSARLPFEAPPSAERPGVALGRSLNFNKAVDLCELQSQSSQSGSLVTSKVCKVNDSATDSTKPMNSEGQDSNPHLIQSLSSVTQNSKTLKPDKKANELSAKLFADRIRRLPRCPEGSSDRKFRFGSRFHIALKPTNSEQKKLASLNQKLRGAIREDPNESDSSRSKALQNPRSSALAESLNKCKRECPVKRQSSLVKSMDGPRKLGSFHNHLGVLDLRRSYLNVYSKKDEGPGSSVSKEKACRSSRTHQSHNNSSILDSQPSLAEPLVSFVPASTQNVWTRTSMSKADAQSRKFELKSKFPKTTFSDLKMSLRKREKLS